MMPGRSYGRQRGSAAVEVAVLVPLIGFLLAALAGGWRVGWARMQVTEAAAAGARAATVPTTATDAIRLGRTAVEQDLRTVGIHCANLGVTIDTSAYGNPPGTPGGVTAAVTCLLDLSDVVASGLPGSITVSASAHEPLDTFRERRP